MEEKNVGRITKGSFSLLKPVLLQETPSPDLPLLRKGRKEVKLISDELGRENAQTRKSLYIFGYHIITEPKYFQFLTQCQQYLKKEKRRES